MRYRPCSGKSRAAFGFSSYLSHAKPFDDTFAQFGAHVDEGSLNGAPQAA